MNRRSTQFGVRKNPDSQRVHGLRLAIENRFRSMPAEDVNPRGGFSPTRRHPASNLTFLSCATSSHLGTCSIAKITAKVTGSVICVVHAPVTFLGCGNGSRLFKTVSSHTIKRPRKWKSSIGMFTSELQENSSESLRGGKATGVLYLLGNIQ